MTKRPFQKAKSKTSNPSNKPFGKPTGKPPGKPSGKPSGKPDSAAVMRLNQFLAQSVGVSRRAADKLIAEGHVKVNGKRAEVGQSVHSVLDEVSYQGKVCRLARKEYLVFYKPKGLISTRKDPAERKTIYDVLPPECADLRSAGRLDRQTSGLLILSNDGDFLNRLIHPSHQWAKKYRVTVDTVIKSADLGGLQTGVLLQPENKLAVLSILEQRDEFTVVVSTKTGYNRQIRRMFEAQGYTVKDLKRLAIGPIELRGLRPGETRPLTLTKRNQILKGSQAVASAAPKGKASSATPVKKPQHPATTGRQTRSSKPTSSSTQTTTKRNQTPAKPKPKKG